MVAATLTEPKYYINKVNGNTNELPEDGSLSIVTQEGTWILFFITREKKLAISNCMKLVSTYFLKSKKYKAIDVKKVQPILNAFKRDYKTISRLSSTI